MKLFLQIILAALLLLSLGLLIFQRQLTGYLGRNQNRGSTSKSLDELDDEEE